MGLGTVPEAGEVLVTMRKALFVILAAAGLSMVPAGVAFAGGNAGSPPGSTTAMGNTDCAAHGAFGAFGTFGPGVHDFGINNLGGNGEPGASSWQDPNLVTGQTTGGNNNSLCGGGNVPAPFAP